LRTLEIVAAISRNERLTLALTKLLRHPNARIRSKVTLLLARGARNMAWIERQLAEAEPRVRANAVEGLWYAEDTERKRRLLWQAAEDAHHRVIGNALVGLCRMGDREAVRRLEELAVHGSPSVRATAAWAMGEVGLEQFLHVLPGMVRDEDRAVRTNVLRALARLRRTFGLAQAS
jgi:HEAT repeat protein